MSKASAHKPSKTPERETVTVRSEHTLLELRGMSRQQIEAIGAERFEQLLAEAFEAEVQKRMEGFDAAMTAARTMIDAGRAEEGLRLLRSAAVALSRDGVRQRELTKRFARMCFGPRSEKLDGEELRQLFLAFGGDDVAFDAALAEGSEPAVSTPPPPTEPLDEPAPAPDDSPAPAKKKRPNHHGRRPLVTSCPIIEKTVQVPADERSCALCGSEKACIHYVRHERMEFEPARLVLHVERREVLSCNCCRKDVVTAPRADSCNWGRRIGNSVVADLIAEKCSEAQPLHRERERYRRLGWDVPASTLDDAWAWGTDLLILVADIVRGQILARDYVQADSTILRVLDPKNPKGRFTGQVWGFVSGGQVAFEFTESWAADEIVQSFHLAPDGYKQVDDYKGYASSVEFNGQQVQLVRPDKRLGCGMHIRRNFVDAFQAKDQRAAVPLEYFRQLYEVEDKAKAQQLSFEQRHLLRQQASQPVLANFRQWLDSKKDLAPPKTPLGSAIHYANQQWPFFERCFTRGDFEIDNGAIEREFRTIALGRHNFLFTGSVLAAKRLCAAYTLVVNAKRLGLDPFHYIKDVLDRLSSGSCTINRVAELTPQRWAAAHAAGQSR